MCSSTELLFWRFYMVVYNYQTEKKYIAREHISVPLQ
jgi:hypothetical protein